VNHCAGLFSTFGGASSSSSPTEQLQRVIFKMDPRRDRIGQRSYHEGSGDNVCHAMVRGMDYIRDPRLFKGMAFSLEERQALGIHGLLPPCFKTQEEQVKHCKENVDRYSEDLNKYIYLVGLQDRNERLFYRLLAENVEQMMPLVYTPTVGLACQKFGLIFRRPRGLFISIHDKGHVYDIIKNWPETDVRAIVVTDGERILGLGDLGAYGMGIPVGKLALYTALAGIKPHQCLPIQLDVGTNTQSLLDDPFYIGLRHKRIQGQEYDEFLEEFMQAVVRRYGQNTLIQFEDFGNHNAFRLLAKYRDRFCTFNDDIQGTASVALAGILASLRITKNKLADNKYLFLGAGEASLGIATLIVNAMTQEGVSRSDALKKIWLCDSKGLIVKSRTDLNAQKSFFAQDEEPEADFYQIVSKIKPTAIIGASAQPGAFSEKILNKMGEINDRPVIFALSNPTHKAECTAEQAYKLTDGRCVFASGSPFPTYIHSNGKKYMPGQGNNAYIFPGVALGVIAAGIHHISDDVFLQAAKSLANLVKESDLEVGRVYPPLQDILNVSLIIAKEICEEAYRSGTASTYPEPADKEAFVRAQLYDYTYTSAIPSVYSWPESALHH